MIKLKAGSLNYWTTDGELIVPGAGDPNPPLITGELRPMTDAEIVTYLKQRAALNDYDD